MNDGNCMCWFIWIMQNCLLILGLSIYAIVPANPLNTHTYTHTCTHTYIQHIHAHTIPPTPTYNTWHFASFSREGILSREGIFFTGSFILLKADRFDLAKHSSKIEKEKNNNKTKVEGESIQEYKPILWIKKKFIDSKILIVCEILLGMFFSLNFFTFIKWYVC